jgi:hypothetical protein
MLTTPLNEGDIAFKTGAPSSRSGEFTLVMSPADATAQLTQRVFIHQREWKARIEPSVCAEFVSAFLAAGLSNEAAYTGEPGTLVTRVTWRTNERIATALLGEKPEELKLQRLAEQVISQIAPGHLELGRWNTERKLVLESTEVTA